MDCVYRGYYWVDMLIITFVGQRTRVSGHSMEATLHDGDNLIVDKLSYRFRDPKRFEIIVFPYRHKENTYYIKRIIGLPGETVQVKDGYVYIDGEKLDENYGLEVMEDAGIAAEPIELGEDENILCLAITEIIAQTAVIQALEFFTDDELIGRAWIRILAIRQYSG